MEHGENVLLPATACYVECGNRVFLPTTACSVEQGDNVPLQATACSVDHGDNQLHRQQASGTGTGFDTDLQDFWTELPTQPLSKKKQKGFTPH